MISIICLTIGRPFHTKILVFVVLLFWTFFAESLLKLIVFHFLVVMSLSRVQSSPKNLIIWNLFISTLRIIYVMIVFRIKLHIANDQLLCLIFILFFNLNYYGWIIALKLVIISFLSIRNHKWPFIIRKTFIVSVLRWDDPHHIRTIDINHFFIFILQICFYCRTAVNMLRFITIYVIIFIYRS